MIVTFEYAVLTFLPDLTDPQSQPVPVGVIAVGPLTPTHGFCFVATARRSAIPIEHDSFGLLTDLPGLLDKLIQQALIQVGAGRVLPSLNASLGHTLALGSPVVEAVSLATDPVQIDELLQALSPLYERHVLSAETGRSGETLLPAVRFDVTEMPAP